MLVDMLKERRGQLQKKKSRGKKVLSPGQLIVVEEQKKQEDLNHEGVIPASQSKDNCQFCAIEYDGYIGFRV